MKVSIISLLGRDVQRGLKILKYFFFAVVLGIGLAFLCLSQASAQNYSQPTLVDSIDLSDGVINQKGIDKIEQDVKEVYNEIVLLEKTKFTLEETLKTLYIQNPDDSATICTLEKELFSKCKQIEQCKLLILATCEKLTGLTVIKGKGRRATKYLYSGAQLWMHVQQDLYDAGY